MDSAGKSSTVGPVYFSPLGDYLMIHSRSIFTLLAATLALSACSYMPDMPTFEGSSSASKADNNVIGEERTAQWQQAPAPSPALTTTAPPAAAQVMAPVAAPSVEPANPVITPMPEQSAEPVSSAEPMIEHGTMK